MGCRKSAAAPWRYRRQPARAPEASRLLQALAPMPGSPAQMLPQRQLAALQEWLWRDARRRSGGRDMRHRVPRPGGSHAVVPLQPRPTPQLHSLALGLRQQ